MVTVNTYAELVSAINALEDDITIASNIIFSNTININYSVTIYGSNSAIVLNKVAGFTGSIFIIGLNGALNISDLVFEGDNNVSSPFIYNNASVIVDNCIFRNISSNINGSALFTTNNGVVIATNTSFINNSSTNVGGALFQIMVQPLL